MLIPLSRSLDKPRRKRRRGGRTDNHHGLVFHHHVAAEDHDSSRGDLVHGFLRRLRRAAGQRVYSRSAGSEPRWARRSSPAHCGHVQAAAERRFYAALRQHVLLLVGAVPGSGAGHYHYRGRAVRQHVVRSANGRCRRERRDFLCIRDFLAGRLRDCDWRLGIQFEVSVPGRHSFQCANAFLRAFARARSYSCFSSCWKFAADERRAVPDRARLVYRSFRWRLDESVEMAARDSNDHLFPGVHDCNFRRDKPAAFRFAGSRAGARGRLQHRIQLDEVRALFSRRICGHDHRVGCRRDPIFWRLAFPGNPRWLPWMGLRTDQHRGIFH